MVLGEEGDEPQQLRLGLVADALLAPEAPPLALGVVERQLLEEIREIVDGRDVGPSPLRRDGPVNPDARQRELPMRSLARSCTSRFYRVADPCPALRAQGRSVGPALRALILIWKV